MRLTRRDLLRWASALGSAAALQHAFVSAAAALPPKATAVEIPQAPESVPEVQRVKPSRLEVQMLGGYNLRVDGQFTTDSPQKLDRAKELLALLILNPSGLPSMALGKLMFPDTCPDASMHRLQMAAYVLRKHLGNRATVRYRTGVYQLHPDLEVLSDVLAFDRAFSKARTATGAARVVALSKSIELYRGPLLPGFRYAWLEPVRSDYQTRYEWTSVLHSMLTRHGPTGQSA